MAGKLLSLARLRSAFLSKNSFSTSAARNGSAPHGSAMYRMREPPCTYGPRIKAMTCAQTFIWGNIFYSFWYQPELALGHILYQPPDPSLWTDEDLGIPPDDYDEVIELGKAYYVQSA